MLFPLGDEPTGIGLDSAEGTASRALPAPPKPTKQMIEDHEVSHLPFRNWCTACVRGRAKSMPHFKQNTEEEVYSTYSADYGFFGVPGGIFVESVAGKDLPVQVGYDRKAQCPFAHPVPHKGLRNDQGIESIYGVKCLVGDLNRLGYKKVNVKSDQEPAIMAVITKAKEMWPGEIILEKAPKGEKASNDEAQRAVQSIHGLA